MTHKIFGIISQSKLRLPRWLSGKEPACQCRRWGFDPWVGKIPRRKKWQATPVRLPGESHGQRSLVGYSPGFEKSQTWLSSHACSWSEPIANARNLTWIRLAFRTPRNSPFSRLTLVFLEKGTTVLLQKKSLKKYIKKIFLAALCGKWDPSSSSRDQTWILCIGRWNLNRRKVWKPLFKSINCCS